MESMSQLAWLIAAVCFILSLGGLSQHSTARRGNILGIIGMTLAILCLLYTSPSPRDRQKSRMPSSA